MLFSMAVIPTSAASEYGVSFTFKDANGNNVITSAEKGDMVRLYININTGDKKASALQLTFFYDASVFTVYRSTTAALGTGNGTLAVKYAGKFADKTEYDIFENDDYVNEDTIGTEVYYECSKYGTRQYSFAANEPDSWDDAKKAQYNVVKLIHGLSTADNVLFINTNGAYEEFAYVLLKVSEDTELTSAVVGIDDTIDSTLNYFEAPQDQSYNFAASAINNGVRGSAVYAVGSTATLDIGVVAQPTVEFAGTMGQMKDWNTLTGPFNGGLVGRISNLPLTFPNGVCAEISHIYVTIKTSEGETTRETYTVYPQDGGTYLFRGVVAGMDITSEDTFQYKFTVELTTGGTLETEYSDPISAKDIFDAANTKFEQSKNA